MRRFSVGSRSRWIASEWDCIEVLGYNFPDVQCLVAGIQYEVSATIMKHRVSRADAFRIVFFIRIGPFCARSGRQLGPVSWPVCGVLNCSHLRLRCRLSSVRSAVRCLVWPSIINSGVCCTAGNVKPE